MAVVDLTTVRPTREFHQPVSETMKELLEDTFPEALEKRLGFDVKYSVREFPKKGVQYTYFLDDEVYVVSINVRGEFDWSYQGRMQ